LHEEPDEVWLQDLHLFAVVSRDFITTAAANPEVYKKPRKAIDLDGFFQKLGTVGEVGLRRILYAYASRDPSAAFRIAELCDFDIIANLPEVVVENRDDPAILAFAIESAKESNDVERWGRVLGECALKSEVAAEAIGRAALSKAWVAAVGCVEPRKRWDLVLSQGKGLGDVLTVFFNLGQPSERLAAQEQVDVLAEFPLPGELRAERRHGLVSSVGGIALSLGSVALALSWMPKLPGIVVVAMAYVMMFWAIGRMMNVYMYRLFVDWLRGARGFGGILVVLYREYSGWRGKIRLLFDWPFWLLGRSRVNEIVGGHVGWFAVFLGGRKVGRALRCLFICRHGE
jgi:hypothetical protein